MHPTKQNVEKQQILTPDIQVTNVWKRFKDLTAVAGINLSIEQSEFVALLGPNGAGKTTLVEMIEGIQHPDEGSIIIKGHKWQGNKERLNRILGISLQETRFIDKLTVRETLDLFASFYGHGKKRVQEIMGEVELEEKQKSYVVNLSGGQRQRLALGISLINSPQILLLDEPTTGLDPTARRKIWDILLKLKQQKNTTLILTTHYMEEAEYLCERIIIMDKGKILAQGTLEELLKVNNCSEIIEFSCNGNSNKSALPKNFGNSQINWDTENKKGRVLVSNTVEQLPFFLDFIKEKSIDLKSIECRKMTLDDLFIRLTGRHLED